MKKIKMMRGVRDAKKVAQAVSVALFAPCVDTAFAFEKHHHSIMTQQQKDSGADLARAGIEEVEACMDAKKTHAEKLKSDPEYALRDKLNQKSNELSRVIGENYKKLVELTEKEGKLNEKFDPLYSDEEKLLQHKAITILDKLDTLTQKEKALDISELLPKEKDKIKNFSSKADELDTKRQALNNKMEAYNDRTSILSENFNTSAVLNTFFCSSADRGGWVRNTASMTS